MLLLTIGFLRVWRFEVLQLLALPRVTFLCELMSGCLILVRMVGDTAVRIARLILLNLGPVLLPVPRVVTMQGVPVKEVLCKPTTTSPGSSGPFAP